jgi:hypothetical protein
VNPIKKLQMKKIFCFLVFVSMLAPLFVGAQVGIGTLVPDPSALLELDSTTEGLLIPRMSTTERDLIEAPVVGLFIFNTSTSSFNFFDGGWNEYAIAKNYNAIVAGDISTSSTNVNTIVTGMSITPPFSGKYQVTFNSYYGNEPIIRGPFTSSVAKTDLEVLKNYLKSLPATITNHGDIFGNNEVLLPGVYNITAATSTVGTINFDAQGDPNALFVIRMAAAFSTAASTKMVLLNGAKASNIFWVVEDAAAMAASTTLKGTVISGAANSMAAGGDLEGRLFSIAGAVSFSTGTAIIPFGTSGISGIDLGVLSTFIFYSGSGAISNAGTSKITGDIGTNLGAISGLDLPTVFKGSILNPDGSTITTKTLITAEALATFGIYQNGVLIPISEKTLTSDEKSSNISLQGIATIVANQAIDIRWKTNSEKLRIGNRALILIKIQ